MFVPIELPPGVWANGTAYQSKGRWRDANFVRWYEGTIRPIGPWRSKTTDTVTGAARAMITWRDNADLTWGAVGTHSNLFVFDRAGNVDDITPVSFTTGFADASTGGGYGQGNYGAGVYGLATQDDTLIQDATVWSLDTWGEDLVGVSPDDEVIYEWTLNTGTPAAAVANAPPAKALVVTEEEFLVALGANSDHRQVAWSDQADDTLWTPDATNQAGSFTLQTQGHIQCGIRVPGAHLVFTTVDVWRGVYQGPPLVYGYQRIGADCGVISRASVTVAGGVAYWMGSDNFWLYNGYVDPVPSEIADKVFGDFNRVQASKVQAFHNSQFGEVWWFYPSAASTELDRAAIYNYREKHWQVVELTRTCMADRGVFNFPLMVDDSGALFEHEVDFMTGDYEDATVFAETAPMEVGNGDRVFFVRQYIPDENTLGDVTVTFKARMYPNAAEVIYGPYSAADPRPLRFCARQVATVFTGGSVTDWRIGVPRLEGTLGGYR